MLAASEISLLADVFVLGAPQSALAAAGGRLHVFCGRFDHAVRYAVNEVPDLLHPFTVLRTERGRWMSYNEISSEYLDMEYDSAAL